MDEINEGDASLGSASEATENASYPSFAGRMVLS